MMTGISGYLQAVAEDEQRHLQGLPLFDVNFLEGKCQLQHLVPGDLSGACLLYTSDAADE